MRHTITIAAALLWMIAPAHVDDRAAAVERAAINDNRTPAGTLRDGVLAEPVAVMNDGSTFAIHGDTRTFWVKLWHAAGTDQTKIDRAQIISCIPSTRGVQILVESPDE